MTFLMLDGFTIAFDLDGTLVETAPDLSAAVNHVLAVEGFEPVAPDLFRNQISFGGRAMIVEALRLRGAVLPVHHIDRLVDVFRQHYEANIAVHSRPFPFVIDVLNTYRRQGCRTVVCTNKWTQMSERLLQHLEMRQLFDAVAGRDTFSVCKPHPDHLLGAIQMAGGDPRRAVMVGDSDTDISTARAAGIPSLAVTFGYTDVPVATLGPTHVIDTYQAFDTAMDKILATPFFTIV